MKCSLGIAVLTGALCVLSACGGGGGNGNNGGGPQVATHFAVTAPATASVNTFFSVTVLAFDASNSPVVGYSGTVHFTSSDPHAVLSADSTLTNGAGTFSASLASIGDQTITATDTVSSAINGSSAEVDVANNSNAHGFQATGEMGTERAAHTATLLADGKVLITGGFNGTDVLASAELYDPATGTFTATGTMTTPRFSHTATVLANGPAATNGKVLITGGSGNLGDLATHDSRRATSVTNGRVRATSGSDTSDDLATAELYDPATGTFTATGSMGEGRSEHTATLLNNGKVLVVGGVGTDPAELFDPATGSFTPTGGTITVDRWGSAASLLGDGTVLITGGRDAEDVFDGIPIDTAELFDPTTGNLTQTGNMTGARYGHTSTTLNIGKVLLAGGTNGNSLQSAELFDPGTGTFAVTGIMGSPRAKHTATLLSDGTVLVAGGFSFSPSPGGGFPNADIFDPATGMFTSTGRLGTARFLHTATRLNDGRVLITGGESKINPSVFTSSAELYK